MCAYKYWYLWKNGKFKLLPKKQNIITQKKREIIFFNFSELISLFRVIISTFVSGFRVNLFCIWVKFTVPKYII